MNSMLCVTGKFEFYLRFFEEGNASKTLIYDMKIDVDHVFRHAVPLETILSIIAQSV